MTKIRTAVSVLFVGVIALGVSESSKAALIDRGNGLIYDNVLDITWIQDVGLSSTQGGPSSFNWDGANAWAEQLVFGGHDDWRLPTLSPVNGVAFNRVLHCDGSADYGWGIAAPGGASAGFIGNELAYMYHVNLGNEQSCTGPGPYTTNKQYKSIVPWANASFVDPLTNETVSFLNLQGLRRGFWDDLAPLGGFTWYFFYNGLNDWSNAVYGRGSAWAVRDGDVFVVPLPEPAVVSEPSTLLLLSGLLPGLW